jgi:hypothetical protein
VNVAPVKPSNEPTALKHLDGNLMKETRVRGMQLSHAQTPDPRSCEITNGYCFKPPSFRWFVTQYSIKGSTVIQAREDQSPEWDQGKTDTMGEMDL